MELLVDGQPRQSGAGRTLADELAALQRELGSAGRSITAVLLDGRELSPAEEEALLSRGAAEGSRIEVRTADSREWGRHGLGEAASALLQLADQFRAAADDFRAARMADGLERLNGAIAGYGQVVKALITAAQLAGAAPPADLRRELEAVTAGMRELSVAVGQADGVAAADLAEYELPGHLEALAGVVKGMAGGA